ncbi:MAG: SUMF1/EgtB/PvdO family nonheme iron enzyme [Planctomycetota bacterium]
MVFWFLIFVLTSAEPETRIPYVSFDEALVITAQIEQLSADTFAERERAFFHLQCFREKAMPFLKSARANASFFIQKQIDYLLLHVPIRQELIEVPGGRVRLGSEDPLCRNPLREKVLKPYAIDCYETTNFMYYVFVRSTDHAPPGTWKEGKYRLGDEDHPVTGVTYDDARAFAAWCGKRLPSADEWEFAARGMEGNLFPWGDQEYRGAANIDNMRTFGSDAVGSYKDDTSPLGCKDMAGNVSEWVMALSPDGNPIPACLGSAFNKTWRRPYTLCSYGAIPKKDDYQSRDTGFRCVR